MWNKGFNSLIMELKVKDCPAPKNPSTTCHVTFHTILLSRLKPNGSYQQCYLESKPEVALVPGEVQDLWPCWTEMFLLSPSSNKWQEDWSIWDPRVRRWTRDPRCTFQSCAAIGLAKAWWVTMTTPATGGGVLPQSIAAGKKHQEWMIRLTSENRYGPPRPLPYTVPQDAHNIKLPGGLGKYYRTPTSQIRKPRLQEIKSLP